VLRRFLWWLGRASPYRHAGHWVRHRCCNNFVPSSN
jgi:hypothetical protein